MSERVYLFSNGSQHMDWTDRNCCRCAKDVQEGKPVTCELQIAMGEAFFGDGSVPTAMAKRLGYSDPLAYTWDCAERVSK